MSERPKIKRRPLVKFLTFSIIGMIAFMLPIQTKAGINTVVGMLSDYMKQSFAFCLDEIILSLVVASFLMSLYDYVMCRCGKKSAPVIHKIFHVNLVYLLTKLLAAAVVIICYYSMPVPMITGVQIGPSMISLGKTLVALALAMSFLLPFFTDAGLMEFVGIIAEKYVRPLFRVPSDASVDLIASWLGASSAAVILSAEKYKKGYYTKREAACVMCNFSLVSIPFCMVVAGTARVEQYFPIMYGLLCLLGIFLAILLPRIYPLNKMKDEYYNKPRIVPEPDGMSGESTRGRALRVSCEVAETFHIRNAFASGLNIMASICLNLLPMVIAWGVLGMIVVEYTPIIRIISSPMGILLNIFRVPEASQAAVGTIAGFIDMFIPALLVGGVASIKTRFIIATLSLIQIIYITEVGIVIIQSDIGVNVGKLFLIFMERTLISLPIIVLVAHLIM